MATPEQAGIIFDLAERNLVQLDGFNLYALEKDELGQSIIVTKEYEPHVTTVIRKLLKQKQWFLDVGGNIGYFSMLAASIVGAEGRVVAVEPNPQNVQLILASAKVNKFESVSVLPVAASNQRTILEFFNYGSNGGVITDKMRRVAEPRWSKLTNAHFFAQAFQLDELIGGFERLDMIKMDIEAHEPSALQGLAKGFRKHRPILVTEFHPWAMQRMREQAPEAYITDILSFGYEISIIPKSGDVIPVGGANDVMQYWRSLEQATMHLDLLARPL